MEDGANQISLTQRDSGRTGIRVDPERQPGEDYNEQRGGVNTHHVEANLSPKGEDNLYTSVVACMQKEVKVEQAHIL